MEPNAKLNVNFTLNFSSLLFFFSDFVLRLLRAALASSYSKTLKDAPKFPRHSLSTPPPPALLAVPEVALRFEEIEAGQVETALQGAFLAVPRASDPCVFSAAVGASI